MGKKTKGALEHLKSETPLKTQDPGTLVIVQTCCTLNLRETFWTEEMRLMRVRREEVAPFDYTGFRRTRMRNLVVMGIGDVGFVGVRG